MTGRSDSDKIEPDRGNTSGRLMFGAALIFAVLATLALVFTTNTQWLKLGVIAALWAAFFGAMLSVKYRHQAAARAGEVADLQAVYELELEREVAARREYELEVEADTRRRIAQETQDSNRENVAALRAELRALRENLERLTGGEVLVERIALRAQSTRMRTLGESNLAARAILAEDERRSITAGPAATRGRAPGRPVGRAVGTVLDPSTELLEPAPIPRQPQRESPPQRQATTRPVSNQRPDGQRRTNMRRDPTNPPLPRQPANSGAYPVPGNSGTYAVPGASTGGAHRGSDRLAQGGRHGSGSYEPVPRPTAPPATVPPATAVPETVMPARSSGRRAQPEPAGAHTAGRSVTELLAAHSSTEDSPRRHRRRAD